MSKDVAIEVRNLNKTFLIRERKVSTVKDRFISLWSKDYQRKLSALNNINFDIYKGEHFGIIGNNGSGKSTLIKILNGAYPPDKGSQIKIDGVILRLALGIGFDPGLSGKDNVYVNASLLGLQMKMIDIIYDEIVAFSGLMEFMNTKVKFYSSGMKSRLAFSIALYTNPDIIMFDEFFGGVGDINFKKKSQKAFDRLVRSSKTIIHVSHSLKLLENRCDRILLLDKGCIHCIGEPAKVIQIYKDLNNEKSISTL